MIDALEIRRLVERDRCDGFSSGHAALDRFLCQHAKQNQRRSESATHVALSGGAIVGFVTVVPGAIEPARLKGTVKGLSRHPAPVLVLARMATDTRFIRMGVGSALFREVVVAGALELASKFGCVGIYTDAKSGAVAFYASLGFVAIGTALPTSERGDRTGEAAAPGATGDRPAPEEATPMFLPLATVRRAATVRPKAPPSEP